MFETSVFEEVTYIVSTSRPCASVHQEEYDKRLLERLRTLCDEVAKEVVESRPLPVWVRYVEDIDSGVPPGGEPTGPDASQSVVVLYPPDRSAFWLVRGFLECLESDGSNAYAVPGDPITGKRLEKCRNLNGHAMVVCTHDEIKLCRYRKHTPGWVNVFGGWIWQSADGELFDDDTRCCEDFTTREWDGWDAKVVVHRMRHTETEEKAKCEYPGLLESAIFLPSGEPNELTEIEEVEDSSDANIRILNQNESDTVNA